MYLILRAFDSDEYDSYVTLAVLDLASALVICERAATIAATIRHLFDDEAPIYIEFSSYLPDWYDFFGAGLDDEKFKELVELDDLLDAEHGIMIVNELPDIPDECRRKQDATHLRVGLGEKIDLKWQAYLKHTATRMWTEWFYSNDFLELTRKE